SSSCWTMAPVTPARTAGRRSRPARRGWRCGGSRRTAPISIKKEREWRTLKRDVRSHLARSLRAFADEILTGLAQLGGERCDIVDAVPQWFLDGHRRPPTGRKPGRPKGAKDSSKRVVRRKNLPADT